MSKTPVDKKPDLKEALIDLVYDKTSAQRFSFRYESEEEAYELIFGVNNLEDKALFQFDDMQEIVIVEEGKSRFIKVDNLKASVWFFDNHITLVDGFDTEDGKLPEDWKDYFDEGDKQEVVNAVLFADVHITTTIKTPGKFKFGSKANSEKTIAIKANYNDTQVIVNFDFPEKQSKHTHQYREIIGSAEFKPGRDGTFIPNNWEDLIKLYDEIGVKSNSSNPAVHLKIIALRERYDTQMHENTKKLKS